MDAIAFDFTFVLAILVLVSGGIWATDRIFFAPRRRLIRERTDELAPAPVLVEYARVLLPVFLFLLVVRAFVAEPFRIPSESMEPGLRPGDFIMVSKFSYALRLPITNFPVVSLHEPARGDVAVFLYPVTDRSKRDPMTGNAVVKRIVGLPGDRVAVRGDRVTLNGQAVSYQAIPQRFTAASPDSPNHGPRVLEHLPGSEHVLLDQPGTNFGPQEWTVPEGQYFVMGDNRDRSVDSRSWGFVPARNLYGKALFIWLNCRGPLCSDEFDTSRVGLAIR